ncbi:MAG: ATP-binding protein [Eubacteriales bacterium]
MKIAIASGKGGTGKTTISIALALAIDEKVQLLDCDVEEPNADLFLDLENTKEETVNIPIPSVDIDKCIFCGKCQEICQFNVIAVLKDNVLIFDELCHGCGGCEMICPQNAISEQDMPIGKIIASQSKSLSFTQGRLDIGRAMSPPLIRAVKRRIDDSIINIIDCPPGSSCPLITAINGADYIVLVTEASPFGLNDLIITVDTIKSLKTPFGVVINRAKKEYKQIHEYCAKNHIKILLEIPENMAAAKAYSNGNSILNAIPSLKAQLNNMLSYIQEVVA